MFDETQFLEETEAGSTVDSWCPYCGETVELSVDLGGGSSQSYVEDCPVCCRPWSVIVRWDASGEPSVELRAEDDN